MSTSTLTITPGEEPRLRQVMKDIQNDVAAYHAETARGGDLGVHARNWLGRVQNLNDLFTKAPRRRRRVTSPHARPRSQ